MKFILGFIGFLCSVSIGFAAAAPLSREIPLEESQSHQRSGGFDVYGLIGDIAKSQGLSYEHFADLATHPGEAKTKALIIDLFEAILEKEEDERTFRQSVNEKIQTIHKELDPTLDAQAVWRQYCSPHPWFNKPDEQVKYKKEQLFQRFYAIISSEKSNAIIDWLKTQNEGIAVSDWNMLFYNCMEEIKIYLINMAQKPGNLKLKPADIDKMKREEKRREGNFWDANRSERIVSWFSLCVAILRLCLPYVEKKHITDSRCRQDLWITGLDTVLFEDTEIGETATDPDSLFVGFSPKQTLMKQYAPDFYSHIPKKIKKLCCVIPKIIYALCQCLRERKPDW